MPELPEVETIKRGLELRIVDRTILLITVRNPNLRRRVPTPALRAAAGAKVTSIRRRAKYLIFELDTQRAILIHLGMSGRLSLVAPETPLSKHDHLLFGFEGDIELRYHDVRRFGLVLLLSFAELAVHPLLSHLGPEPLGRGFTTDYLKAKAAKRKIPVKSYLMNSRIVVGIGNIYVNEILFAAGIHPLQPVGEILETEWDALRTAVRKVLRTAIGRGGTTLKDGQFRNASGELGYFQQKLCVYDREGEPCVNCAAEIVRITLCNRSTYYCPICQG